MLVLKYTIWQSCSWAVVYFGKFLKIHKRRKNQSWSTFFNGKRCVLISTNNGEVCSGWPDGIFG
jgi:hypothetical protein